MLPEDRGKIPSEWEVKRQLERLTASEVFSRSRRLSGLLEYLVGESLAGRGGKIKATTIAIEVFGRGEDFDQQGDPIVRVEAGRLRQRLADYYNGPGKADPLLIEIPKGGYRPNFLPREASTGAQAAAGPDNPGERNEPDRRLRIAATIIAILLVLVGVLFYQAHLRPGKTPDTAVEFVAPSPEGKPYIVVIPVAAHSRDLESNRLASGLVESLITHLSKLSGLSVMAHASVLEAQERNEPYSISDFRSEFGVTHLLRGTMEREGSSVFVNVQLVDARTAAVVWAERLSRPLGTIIDLEEELAVAIAAELAVQLQPGERERLSQLHASNSEAWLLYRQGLVTIMPPNDLARVEAARKLFQRALEFDPSFAGAYAGQSFSHSARVLFMNTPHPEVERNRAIELAQRAISLDKDFAGGYAMLAFAQMQGEDIERALHNARKAVSIQPGDAFSRFILGMNLSVAGRATESIANLKEALRLDPLETRMPYLNVMGIAYYAAGDYSNALRTIEYNYDKGGPRGPHMDVFMAASSAQLGELSQARDIIGVMQQRYPGFPYRAWVSRWLVDDIQLRLTLDLLVENGLELADVVPGGI